MGGAVIGTLKHSSSTTRQVKKSQLGEEGGRVGKGGRGEEWGRGEGVGEGGWGGGEKGGGKGRMGMGVVDCCILVCQVILWLGAPGCPSISLYDGS